MDNTFTGMVLKVRNQGIHALVNETFTFRRQLTLIASGGEFHSQNGWGDATNAYMMRELESLCATIKDVTYSTSSSDGDKMRADAIAMARDTKKTLADTINAQSSDTDNIVMPASLPETPFPYDLSGAHPDYPQPTPEFAPNPWARMFISGLDSFVVALSQLDSRSQPYTINAAESAQLIALLGQLLMICQQKGGDANKKDIPTGVLASQMPQTFNASGQYNTPAAAAGK